MNISDTTAQSQSKSMDMSPMSDKIQQLHEQKSKREKKLEEIRERSELERERIELQECTFNPEFVARNQSYQIQSGRFLDRGEHWFRSKEKKIEEQRFRKKAEQTKRYTFQPQRYQKTGEKQKRLANDNAVLSNKKQARKLLPETIKSKINAATYSSQLKPISTKSKRSYQQIHKDKQQLKDKIKDHAQPFELATSYSQRWSRNMCNSHLNLESQCKIKQISGKNSIKVKPKLAMAPNNSLEDGIVINDGTRPIKLLPKDKEEIKSQSQVVTKQGCEKLPPLLQQHSQDDESITNLNLNNQVPSSNEPEKPQKVLTHQDIGKPDEKTENECV